MVATDFGPRSAAVERGPWGRLYEQGVEDKAQRDKVQRAQQQADEAAEEESVQRAQARHGSASRSRAELTVARLYTEELARRATDDGARTRERLKLEEARDGVRESTFQPTVPKASLALAGRCQKETWSDRLGSHRETWSDRLVAQSLEAAAALERRRSAKAVREKQLTTPRITKKADALARQGEIGSRLHMDATQRGVRRAASTDGADAQARQAAARADVVETSKHAAAEQRAAVEHLAARRTHELYADAERRREAAQARADQAQAAADVLARTEFVTRRSQQLASKMSVSARDRLDAAAAQSACRHREVVAALLWTAAANAAARSKGTDAAGKAARHEALYRDAQQARDRKKATALHQVLADLEGCTFSPALAKPRARDGDVGDVGARAEAWLLQRNSKRAESARLRDAAELDGCTFKPFLGRAQHSPKRAAPPCAAPPCAATAATMAAVDDRASSRDAPPTPPRPPTRDDRPPSAVARAKPPPPPPPPPPLIGSVLSGSQKPPPPPGTRRHGHRRGLFGGCVRA
ncbi:hypothetical protein M885DRAFT_587810 [Pelagophyceae sp. CCMP2097]|nr:hypothetical protein M885DRAFT_587810 [Pelagophyceae sp. CCMP2097]